MSKGKGIKKTTLVIGMDIGWECNAMVVMNKGGEVLGRYPRFLTHGEGLSILLRQLRKRRGDADSLEEEVLFKKVRKFSVCLVQASFPVNPLKRKAF